MSLVRKICFQKKILRTLLYKLGSPVLTYHNSCEKLSVIPVRFRHSELINSSRKNKLCSDEMHEKTLKSGKMFSVYEKSLQLEDLVEPDLHLVLDRFGMQGLDMQHLKKYDIRVSTDFTSVLFPLSSSDERCSALQIVVYNQDENSHFYSEFEKPVLFGWSQLNAHDKTLVVTSNPLDAIAVNQSTNLAAISLPVSDLLGYSFPPEVLTLFTTFEKVIFWMKADLHSFKIHKLLDKILEERGFVVRPAEFKNPLFCLQNGFNVKQILKKADSLHNKSLGTIKTYKDIIYQRIIGSEEVSGLKWKRFSPLNAILKGHRKGELTVITGHTGTGKTTFMCEYALDLCMQGLETLWISLEVSNDRILSTMLSQFSECPLEKISENYDHWIDKFDEELPMLIIILPKCSSLDGIFSAMQFAVRVKNVKHIVVDNLQFMMNLEDYNSVLDQLRRQDQIFAAFRNFSTVWDCHITLVVHPRKEQEFSELTATSISGTAKTTQEADNVLILQSTKTKQYLEISKNRFDGHKGCVLLEFDKDTYTFTMKELQSRPRH